MKVLHLIKTTQGARWALEQARHLRSLGVDVHVALPDDEGLAPDYQAAGATVHVLQTDIATNPLSDMPYRLKALRRLIKRVDPQVVHSHFVGTTVAARLALRGLATPLRVFQVPGPLHLEHRVFGYGERSLALASDYWIASCRWTLNKYRSCGVPQHRLFLSYYGFDVEEFKRRTNQKVEGVTGLGANSVGIVAHMYAPKRYLGQTRGLKGHEDLIDAMVLVRRKIPSATLVVVGAAWAGRASYERYLQRYAAQRLADGVTFLGHRSDVPAVYSALSVAVHPSHSENVGGACESLLAGVPTVATTVGGFPDVVRPGETGWLVPPKRPELLADAICEALVDRNRALSMAGRGRELVERLFDIRVTSSQVADIYRHILAA